MFDLAPLETWHLILFLALFIMIYLAIGRIIKNKPQFLKVKDKPIIYIGWLIPIAITTATWFVLDDTKKLIGITAVAVITILIGRLDERITLSPARQLFWQIVAIVTVVSLGWNIPYVSNPWTNGIIILDTISIGTWIIPGSILAAIWLLFITNAINWFDGVDGLAGSISLIAFGALAAVSILPSTQDSTTLILALIGAATTMAFLMWNFPPAKAYLGTSGTWFIGIYIGLVAMYGGGKMVTTLVVLALPALDAIIVAISRIISGKAPWKGDKKHLHHKMIAKGFSPTTITILAIIATLALAWVGIVLPTQNKLAVLLILACIFALSIRNVSYKKRI